MGGGTAKPNMGGMPKYGAGGAQIWQGWGSSHLDGALLWRLPLIDDAEAPAQLAQLVQIAHLPHERSGASHGRPQHRGGEREGAAGGALGRRPCGRAQHGVAGGRRNAARPHKAGVYLIWQVLTPNTAGGCAPNSAGAHLVRHLRLVSDLLVRQLVRHRHLEHLPYEACAILGVGHVPY